MSIKKFRIKIVEIFLILQISCSQYQEIYKKDKSFFSFIKGFNRKLFQDLSTFFATMFYLNENVNLFKKPSCNVKIK